MNPTPKLGRPPNKIPKKNPPIKPGTNENPVKKKLGNTHTRTRAHAQKETSRRCGSDALPWRRRRRALRMQMSHANELSPSLVETASRFFFHFFSRAYIARYGDANYGAADPRGQPHLHKLSIGSARIDRSSMATSLGAELVFAIRTRQLINMQNANQSANH